MTYLGDKRKVREKVFAGIAAVVVLVALPSLPGLRGPLAGTGIIPSERRILWKPGIYGGIPYVPVKANVRDFGAVGDGITDDSGALASAIKSITTSGAVLIPADTYLIKSPLTIDRGVVLRGEGASSTHLLFNFPGSPPKNAITVRKAAAGPWVNVTRGYTKGSTTLTLANTIGFTPGIFAEIQQANDAAVMYTDPDWNQPWAANAVGQIFKVVSVAGNIITIDEPIRIDYKASLSPQIRTQVLVEYAGIERLHLKRQDPGDAFMVEFRNVAYSWMREVESEYASKSHVIVIAGYRCEIRDSYFHHAYDYGGGGHGYGIELNLHTVDCLIENNIFVFLRHSMLVHLGASGNVLGYNYSREPHRSGDGTTPLPDISVHGHYPNYNLFESNVVQEIGIADFWGPAGPGNTYFRNCVQAKDIYAQDASHKQNIVGNELTAGVVTIRSGVLETLRHGNFYSGSMHWDPSIPDQDIPTSYYLASKPKFFGNMSWPAIGGDVSRTCLIPAEQRYIDGKFVPSPEAETFFAQVAAGAGYSTIFTVVNTGSTAAIASLILTDQLGNPLSATITERTSSPRSAPTGQVSDAEGSSFSITIPTGATKILTLDRPGASDLKSGWARMESSGGALTGVATFHLIEGGTPKTIAGVLSTQPVEFVTIPVDNDSSLERFTGYAVANHNSEDINLRLVLLNEDGTLADDVAPAILNPLGAKKQVSRFVHQDLPSRLKFRGSMVLIAKGGKRFAAVGLLQDKGLLTAIPVIAEKSLNAPN